MTGDWELAGQVVELQRQRDALLARVAGLERQRDALAAACGSGEGFVRYALEFFDWSAFPNLRAEVVQLRDKLVAATTEGI